MERRLLGPGEAERKCSFMLRWLMGGDPLTFAVVTLWTPTPFAIVVEANFGHVCGRLVFPWDRFKRRSLVLLLVIFAVGGMGSGRESGNKLVILLLKEGL